MEERVAMELTGRPRESSPPRETRRCDKCGAIAECTLFPTSRGPNTGALCIACVVGGLRGWNAAST